jgi:hypothetical protein
VHVKRQESIRDASRTRWRHARATVLVKATSVSRRTRSCAVAVKRRRRSFTASEVREGDFCVEKPSGLDVLVPRRPAKARRGRFRMAALTRPEPRNRGIVSKCLCRRSIRNRGIGGSNPLAPTKIHRQLWPSVDHPGRLRAVFWSFSRSSIVHQADWIENSRSMRSLSTCRRVQLERFVFLTPRAVCAVDFGPGATLRIAPGRRRRLWSNWRSVSVIIR